MMHELIMPTDLPYLAAVYAHSTWSLMILKQAFGTTWDELQWHSLVARNLIRESQNREYYQLNSELESYIAEHVDYRWLLQPTQASPDRALDAALESEGADALLMGEHSELALGLGLSLGLGGQHIVDQHIVLDANFFASLSYVMTQEHPLVASKLMPALAHVPKVVSHIRRLCKRTAGKHYLPSPALRAQIIQLLVLDSPELAAELPCIPWLSLAASLADVSFSADELQRLLMVLVGDPMCALIEKKGFAALCDSLIYWGIIEKFGDSYAFVRSSLTDASSGSVPFMSDLFQCTILPHTSASALEAYIPWMELEVFDEGGSRWNFSRKSIHRAMDKGHRLEELDALAISETTLASIKGWAQAHGQFRATSCTLLEVRPESRGFMSLPSLQPYILETLGDGRYLMQGDAERWGRLLEDAAGFDLRVITPLCEDGRVREDETSFALASSALLPVHSDTSSADAHEAGYAAGTPSAVDTPAAALASSARLEKLKAQLAEHDELSSIQKQFVQWRLELGLIRDAAALAKDIARSAALPYATGMDTAGKLHELMRAWDGGEPVLLSPLTGNSYLGMLVERPSDKGTRDILCRIYGETRIVAFSVHKIYEVVRLPLFD